MNLKQVQWKEGKFNIVYAFIGVNCLGTVSYSCDSSRKSPEEDYNATANIGNKVWRFKCASRTEAKEIVEETIEQVLLAFFE